MIGYIGMYAEGLATYLSSSPDEMWVTGPVGRNHRPGVRVRAGTRLGSGDAAVKILAVCQTAALADGHSAHEPDDLRRRMTATGRPRA